MDLNQFSAYQHVTVPVFVVAPDNNLMPRYLWVNDAWSGATGISAADVAGKTEIQLFPGRPDQRAFDHHRAALTTGRGSFFDLPAPWPGHSGPVRTTLTAVSAPDGTITHAVGTCVPAPSAISEAADAAEALSEAEQFIAIAAHDLRTPMRNIQTLASLLKDDFIDHGDGKHGLIDMLEEVASKSGQMITDILAYTQALATTRDTAPTDLSCLCATLRGTLDPQGKVDFRYPGVTVESDSTTLQIALRNLVDNAIKHNTRPDLVVTVEVRNTGVSDITVTVTDNGKGFPAPERLFVRSAGISHERGYGLMAVQRLLTLRGGHISAQNCPDRTGGVITFTLPGRILPEDASKMTEEQVPRLPRTAAR
ncbi:PAS domain-containing sensor histidine kinase [uncultured Roseobacter sp.]|uniref:PAS domain-containing sensor histidine kinase n=1 Tax=uncultured Roseobacter sp. TaxID=114847 RepID=UPI00262E9BDD|nr:PAS domain-containing sensor histidine kinase [uncultured Roseobacter sp.]